MPTCTCALGFSQHERDLFGGWSAQGSGRYSRIARLRVLNLERAIVKVIHENTVGDQLNGSEMLHEFHDESVFRTAHFVSRLRVKAGTAVLSLAAQTLWTSGEVSSFVDPDSPVLLGDSPNKKEERAFEVQSSWETPWILLW